MSAPAAFDALASRLAKADFAHGPLLVGLDFDGTLADIAATPWEAELAPRTRSLLRALSERPDTRVAVISGRALDDVKRKVGLPRVFYGGNHGLELEGPRLRWLHPRARPVEPSVRDALARTLARFDGAIVEDKGLGVALHYRRVAPRLVPRLRERLAPRLARLAAGFRVQRIKRAFEIRPDVGWDKGRALETIRRSLPGPWLAMLVGDDRTDEEGFCSLGPRALTVRVGRRASTHARYVLSRRELVDELLALLAARRGARPAAP